MDPCCRGQRVQFAFQSGRGMAGGVRVPAGLFPLAAITHCQIARQSRLRCRLFSLVISMFLVPKGSVGTFGKRCQLSFRSALSPVRAFAHMMQFAQMRTCRHSLRLGASNCSLGFWKGEQSSSLYQRSVAGLLEGCVHVGKTLYVGSRWLAGFTHDAEVCF